MYIPWQTYLSWSILVCDCKQLERSLPITEDEIIMFQNDSDL